MHPPSFNHVKFKFFVATGRHYSYLVPGSWQVWLSLKVIAGVIPMWLSLELTRLMRLRVSKVLSMRSFDVYNCELLVSYLVV